MRVAINAALPNSVVLVMDFESGEPPESMGGALIAANETCVAVGTLAEHSGESEFVLAESVDEVDQASMHIAFDGRIQSTSGEVSLVSVLNRKLLALPTSSAEVRVRVLVNDDTEPSRIAVVLG
ncbi:MAG: hypothetical protein HS106_16970 [Ideonella sp.]|nr:MAG: hypothetical protein F9K36_04760 [Burkholderiaceae bacterium]MBE7427689.1 hypothetical protein [Ideonella sp.]